MPPISCDAVEAGTSSMVNGVEKRGKACLRESELERGDRASAEGGRAKEWERERERERGKRQKREHSRSSAKGRQAKNACAVREVRNRVENQTGWKGVQWKEKSKKIRGAGAFQVGSVVVVICVLAKDKKFALVCVPLSRHDRAPSIQAWKHDGMGME